MLASQRASGPKRGIATVLFCDRPGTSPYPQANATQARTMEFYRRLGFAERLRERGLPPDYPTDVAYFTRATKHEIARLELPPAQDARALIKTLSGSWSAAELPHRCSQMYIEAVLLDEAKRHPSVSLNFGWRVTGFTEQDDHVTVEAERVSDGAKRVATASYLVSCELGPAQHDPASARHSLRRRGAGRSAAYERSATHDLSARAQSL